MLSLVLSALLGQSPVAVAVVDVSAPDAIYEDVSRALTDDVVQALNKAGFDAQRIDERDLPDEGCRIGPCLGVVARQHHAQVIVIVDAAEVNPKKNSVALAALLGVNGQPLAAKRYTVPKSGKPPKGLGEFVADVSREVGKLIKPSDAGARTSPAP